MNAKNKKTTVKTLSATEIQEYVSLIENFVFSVDKKKRIDYSKLNNQSTCYDHKYEKDLRRKELSVLYLLDEIIFYKTKLPGNSLDIINEIESILFSSNFYRDIIFMNKPFPFVKKIDILNRVIRDNIHYIERNISQSEYKKIISNLGYLFPPKTKFGLLKNAENTLVFMEERKEILKKYKYFN